MLVCVLLTDFLFSLLFSFTICFFPFLGSVLRGRQIFETSTTFSTIYRSLVSVGFPFLFSFVAGRPRAISDAMKCMYSSCLFVLLLTWSLNWWLLPLVWRANRVLKLCFGPSPTCTSCPRALSLSHTLSHLRFFGSLDDDVAWPAAICYYYYVSISLPTSLFCTTAEPSISSLGARHTVLYDLYPIFPLGVCLEPYCRETVRETYQRDFDSCRAGFVEIRACSQVKPFIVSRIDTRFFGVLVRTEKIFFDHVNCYFVHFQVFGDGGIFIRLSFHVTPC